MKKYKMMLLMAAMVATVACSKDDDAQAVVKMPSAKVEGVNNNVVPIPDSGAAGAPAETRISIPNDGIVLDASKVTLSLDLTHPYASDLVIFVVSPSMEQFTLVKRPFSGTDQTGADFVQGNMLSFNAAASGEMVSQSGVVQAGTYLPSAGINVTPTAYEIGNLGDFFNGKSIKGDWNIIVKDYNPADTGTINKVRLTFDTGALE